MSSLTSIHPDTLVVISTLVAISFSKELSIDDLSILGSLLTSIGDGMSLLASQRDIQKSQLQDAQKTDIKINSNTSDDIDDLKKQVEILKRQIEMIKNKQEE